MKVPDYSDLVGRQFGDGRCLNLVVEMFRRVGIEFRKDLEPPHNYSWVNWKRKPEPMDVVFMDNDQHVAICIRDDWLLQAYEYSGVNQIRVSRHEHRISRVARLIHVIGH
jgi:hypothetical protein